MKKFWLIASILANAALLAAVVTQGTRPSQTSAGSDDATPASGDAPRSSVVVRTGESRTVLIAEQTEVNWNQLYDPDYRTFIARLRSVQCPEETIRDIIVTLVNRQYLQRQSQLRLSQQKDSKFWRPSDFSQDANRAIYKQIRAWEKEKRALIKELLGVDPQKEMAKLYGYPDWEEQRWGFLPESKREQISTIQENYQEQEQDLYTKYRGSYNEDLRTEQKLLREKRRQELAQYLTPQEMEEYDLRNSQTASQMNWEIRFFKPSEQEYREIFKTRKAFDEEFFGYDHDPDDKAGQERYRNGMKEVDTLLKAQLGEARYEQYKRGKEYEYQQLLQIADRNGLSPDVADKAYDIRKVLQQEAGKIKTDNTLTQDKRKETLKTMKSTTEKEMSDLLGEAAWSKYKSRHGWWLDQAVQ